MGMQSLIATLAAGSVTYSKLQDVSSTNRLLGRATAGPGVVEEIVCEAAGRTFLAASDSAAQLTAIGAAASLHNHAASAITSGSFDVTRGGTGLTSYVAGQIIYASDTTTLDKLAGNSTTTPKALMQVGNGSAAFPPDWTAIPTAIAGTSNRLTASASTGSITLDISSSYVGQTSITTLGTITTGTWNGTAIASTYIAANAVTFAKMQAVSANVLLGNDATGTAVEEIPCTAAGRALLDDADAAAQRATLGLVIGTNVQAYDGDLTAVAALASNGMTVRTATDTWTTRTITGTSNRVTVTNGDGVSGNPTLDISTSYVGQATITTLGTITTGTWTGTTIAVANGGTGATDASTARTNLGLAIGTNVQAYDAELTSIAGLIPAQGSLLQGASSSTYAVLSPGTAGQVLVTGGASADAAWAWASQTNVAYNGGFDILQRQPGTESTETSYSDDTYAFDRWNIVTQTASVQCSRQTGDTRSRYCGRIKQNQASAQRAGMLQILDADTTRRFVSQTVRAQLRVKCSSSQAIRIALIEWTGTADSPVSDPVNDWTSATFTTGNFFKSTTTTVVAVATVTPSAATWTDLSVTGTVSASCTNLILMVWSEGTMAQNVTLDVTEVFIGHGAESRLWMPPDPTEELIRCRRFFRQINYLTAMTDFPAVKEAAAIWTAFAVVQPAPMRVSPTVTDSTPTWTAAGPTLNHVAVYNLSTAAWVTITGALTNGTYVSDSVFRIKWVAGTSFSGSTGNQGFMSFGATSFVNLSAEL